MQKTLTPLEIIYTINYKAVCPPKGGLKLIPQVNDYKILKSKICLQPDKWLILLYWDFCKQITPWAKTNKSTICT